MFDTCDLCKHNVLDTDVRDNLKCECVCHPAAFHAWAEATITTRYNVITSLRECGRLDRRR